MVNASQVQAIDTKNAIAQHHKLLRAHADKIKVDAPLIYMSITEKLDAKCDTCAGRGCLPYPEGPVVNKAGKVVFTIGKYEHMFVCPSCNGNGCPDIRLDECLREQFSGVKKPQQVPA